MKVSYITLIKTISFQITGEERQAQRICYTSRMWLQLIKIAFHRLFWSGSFFFLLKYVDIQSIISRKCGVRIKA